MIRTYLQFLAASSLVLALGGGCSDDAASGTDTGSSVDSATGQNDAGADSGSGNDQGGGRDGAGDDGQATVDSGADSAPGSDSTAADSTVADSTAADTGSVDGSGARGTVSGHVFIQLPSKGGQVTCGTTTKNDCKGALVIMIFDQDPANSSAKTVVSPKTINSVDLSGGKKVSYSVSGVPASQVWPAALLVESGVAPSPPVPSSGDILGGTATAVTVTANQTSTADIPLAGRQP